MNTYLDHAATTPLHPEVADVMATECARIGNPSSLHTFGRAARRVVEESREIIAERLGARPSEIVFCSGGTEADNLAVKGLYWARRSPERDLIVSSVIEHHAVLDPATWLAAHDGAELDLVPADKTGRIDTVALQSLLQTKGDRVTAISTMWANNETGTVQQIDKVVALAAEHDIPVHSDAVQAAGYLPIDFSASGLDAMSVTAHKIGGPVGIGALVMKRELSPVPLLHGGGQERDVRSGTMPVALIAGFAKAVEITTDTRTASVARIEALRTRLIDGVRTAVPDVQINGDSSPEGRLPNIAHLTFDGCEGDALLMLLDAAGVGVSTGSACQAGVPQGSHVLLAMGFDDEAARGSVRVSLGHTSTEADVDRFLMVLPEAHERARAAKLARRR